MTSKLALKTLTGHLDILSASLHKVQKILLLAGAEVNEILLHGGGFAAVAPVRLDCLEQVRGAAVVQQEYPLSQGPTTEPCETGPHPHCLVIERRPARTPLRPLADGCSG